MRKKIFLGGTAACDVHYEKDMILGEVCNYSKSEITDNYKDADLIVITDTCIGTYYSFLEVIDYIEKVLYEKKEDALVVISGCLAKGVRFELDDRQKAILNQVICVSSDKIIEYVVKMIGVDLNEELLQEFRLPYVITPNGISFSPVSGCLNRCSFCKSNYMNFPLVSNPYEDLEQMVLDINELYKDEFAINYMSIHSSNFSLYGLDLYGKQRCHDAIKLLSSPESIKFVSVGALINWYPELIAEVLNNPKIKRIFVSLESGSERVYNLMNRPIELRKLVEIIKLIRKNRPDIVVNTEFICGFPTETIDDLKKTIDLIYELDINPMFIYPYYNSLQVPSSNFLQHSIDYCIQSVYYAYDRLNSLKNKFEEFILNGEMLVLDKDYNYNVYIVMLIDGQIINVKFDQFDDRYNVNDIIPANKIKCKQLVRKQKGSIQIN